MTLTPHDPKALCPKCGYEDITSIFCAVMGNNLHNAIRRYCTRCAHAWLEAPLDTGAATSTKEAT